LERGGKGLCGPQASGLLLGRADLVRACRLNSNPYSAVGRGMKVGKEEIAGLLKAVELFFAMDEEAVVAEWNRRCQLIATSAEALAGIEATFTKAYENKFPPASPLVHLHFAESARKTAEQVRRELEAGTPSILTSGSATSITVGPQTLQEGEAELIAERLTQILAS
jgi:L-seryl-tRNA(Ser) seleniumtransferase